MFGLSHPPVGDAKTYPYALPFDARRDPFLLFKWRKMVNAVRNKPEG